MSQIRDRVEQFCSRFGVRTPVLLGPMAGVPAPRLSAAVANAGGLGACGALLMQPDEIVAWAGTFRAASEGPFQLNLWIPDPAPRRDAQLEQQWRSFLEQWGPPVPPQAADATPPDFARQCEALLEARPPIVSSVMGLYPPEFIARLKRERIAWFANVSTVAEARAAQDAGADAIVAQGMEAGGHRGCFDARAAERQLIGLVSLVPAIVDAVRLPVVATGGIADARGAAAALALGASAVQIGTGFLRSPEAQIAAAWADALGRTLPEDTVLTRAFSGRLGRSIANDYVRATMAEGAPPPAPYPVQRALTATMRSTAQKADDVQRMQAWAGQSAALAPAAPAAQIVAQVWDGARRLLAWT